MKHVFSNASQVIHLFAQRDRQQTNARCSNVFFERERLYSYGYHYLLAEYRKDKNGNDYVYINDKGYSVTTSGHISEAKFAFHGIKKLYETQTPEYLYKHIKYYLMPKLEKAKKPEIYIEQIERSYNDTQYFLSLCNPNYGEVEQIEYITEAYHFVQNLKDSESFKKYKSEKAQREREKQQKEKQHFLNYINAWLNYNEVEYCEINGYPKNKQNFDDYIRIAKNGTEVETTRGVKVDIREAKILYLMIKNGKDIKGYKIGYYTVISINGTLKIGCHNINKENMVNIGEQILKLKIK